MTDAGAPLYRRGLGERYDALPAPLRAMHDVRGTTVATGVCDIDRGASLLARLIGRVFGMPPAGTAVPVTVRFVPRAGVEIWQRDFDGARFRTVQEAADVTGRLIERIGPLAFLLDVPADRHGLRLVLRRVTLFGVPLPRALRPRIDAEERVDEGLFAFNVAIALPLVGPIVHYRGRLRTPAGPGPPAPS